MKLVANTKLALSQVNKSCLNFMVLSNILIYCFFYYKLVTLSLLSHATLQVLNKALKYTKPSANETFSYMPASKKCLIAYYHRNIIVQLFPEGIDKLQPKENKVNINFIINKAKTAQAEELLKYQANLTARKMYGQELTNVSEDCI